MHRKPQLGSDRQKNGQIIYVILFATGREIQHCVYVHSSSGKSQSFW